MSVVESHVCHELNSERLGTFLEPRRAISRGLVRTQLMFLLSREGLTSAAKRAHELVDQTSCGQPMENWLMLGAQFVLFAARAHLNPTLLGCDPYIVTKIDSHLSSPPGRGGLTSQNRMTHPGTVHTIGGHTSSPHHRFDARIVDDVQGPWDRTFGMSGLE